MLPTILYVVVRLLLDLARLRCQSDAARDLELLALCHEVRVLRRRTQRIAWRPGDRLVLAALSRGLPRADWHAFPSARRRSSAGTGTWSAVSGRRSADAAGRGGPRPRPRLGT